MALHKVFISYHHARDQWPKEWLVRFGKRHSIFVDRSVDTGDIPDKWTDEQIRREIRDRYLRDSTVTIVLMGEQTKRRKHVDWEIHSSMYDGSVNKRSGIVVINLPGISGSIHASFGDEEKRLLYPDISSWTTVDSRAEYERRHPCWRRPRSTRCPSGASAGAFRIGRLCGGRSVPESAAATRRQYPRTGGSKPRMPDQAEVPIPIISMIVVAPGS